MAWKRTIKFWKNNTINFLKREKYKNNILETEICHAYIIIPIFHIPLEVPLILHSSYSVFNAATFLKFIYFLTFCYYYFLLLFSYNKTSHALKDSWRYCQTAWTRTFFHAFLSIPHYLVLFFPYRVNIFFLTLATHLSQTPYNPNEMHLNW